MDDLRHLMKKKADLAMPAEMSALKEWLHDQYPDFAISVQQRQTSYLIVVPVAPLAQDIHLRLRELAKHAKLPEDKIRIQVTPS